MIVLDSHNLQQILSDISQKYDWKKVWGPRLKVPLPTLHWLKRGKRRPIVCSVR